MDVSRQVGIQVKANGGKYKKWLLTKKAEDYKAKNLYYVFVNLMDDKSHPQFHIVPSSTVAKQVKSSHAKWLATRGKGGKRHRDNPLRNVWDHDDKYLNRWDLLGL